jgi:hypothetical protein
MVCRLLYSEQSINKVHVVELGLREGECKGGGGQGEDGDGVRGREDAQGETRDGQGDGRGRAQWRWILEYKQSSRFTTWFDSSSIHLLLFQC